MPDDRDELLRAGQEKGPELRRAGFYRRHGFDTYSARVGSAVDMPPYVSEISQIQCGEIGSELSRRSSDVATVFNALPQ